MDARLKEEFMKKWEKYFGNADLPITFFYSSKMNNATLAEPPRGQNCLICELGKVRKGQSLAYTKNVISCGGAKRYLGYEHEFRPDFDYFLSCGNDKIEGERYIQTPEMVREIMKNIYKIPAEGQFAVFKRWDKLEQADEPVCAIFFATPDVLSGLFMLANYDQIDGRGVISPFGSGCGSIIYQAYLENQKESPKAILGMFDPSARTCVPENTLTFSAPMKKFVKMIHFMDESFLSTKTWEDIKKRIA